MPVELPNKLNTVDNMLGAIIRTDMGAPDPILANPSFRANGNLFGRTELNKKTNKAEVILKLDKKIIGLKNGNGPNFRYASPYMKKQKIEWLKKIQKEINKN